MLHKRLWVSAAIIAIIVLLGFVFSVPHTREVSLPPSTQPANTTPLVSVHDVFKKGTHTISGFLTAPNACATASAQASLEGSTSTAQSILVTLVVPSTTGICLEIPTQIQFSTALSAPANIPISVTVNGVTASTTQS